MKATFVTMRQLTDIEMLLAGWIDRPLSCNLFLSCFHVLRHDYMSDVDLLVQAKT
jgi:hypothetical protein